MLLWMQGLPRLRIHAAGALRLLQPLVLLGPGSAGPCAGAYAFAEGLRRLARLRCFAAIHVVRRSVPVLGHEVLARSGAAVADPH